MKHVMMDLETWGKRPGCAVRSIGAVAFDLDTPREAMVGFYRNVQDRSCWLAGLRIDKETATWWADPDRAAAQSALTSDQQPLPVVAFDFHRWFMSTGAVRLWCHGAAFDEPIWSTAARVVDSYVPWHYSIVRDTRTLYDVVDFNPKSIKREGTYHNAMDDAAYQAECVQAAFKKMGGASGQDRPDLR